MIVEAMQADDVESAINSCASSFKAALRSVAAANSVLPINGARGSDRKPRLSSRGK